MLIDLIHNEIPDLKILENEPMSAHTTFRIGGPADIMAFPQNEEQIIDLLRLCKEVNIKPVVIGRGSNLLVSDDGIRGVVINTTEMCGANVDGCRVTAQCGIVMAKLAAVILQNGLTGFEFAHGIPGSFGGGIMMNAGAYGGELKDCVKKVRAIDFNGNISEFSGDELDFGYRHSCFETGDYIIISGEMELEKGNPDEIRSRMEELAAKRRTSQPLEFPSAGSSFKRPVGAYAAKLIQDCNLKGYSVGGAQVSEKHAGFVINKGNATCADVLKLTDYVRDTVKRETGYDLELEVRVL